MTVATTLYCITMQEAGVSKRVSVRFDDVSKDGHISEEAIKRGESEDAAWSATAPASCLPMGFLLRYSSNTASATSRIE